MSIEKAKKLEDLKSEANKVLEEKSQIVRSQRPVAIVNLLKEMASYFESNKFSIEYYQGKERGFTASYGSISIVISASGDEEEFLGRDYEVELTGQEKSARVSLRLNRGDTIHPPLDGNIDRIIHDYETRYLPAIKAQDLSRLDGSYSLSFHATGLKNPIHISNGKEALDSFFELLNG
ncbi:hypothetical protein ACN5LW_002513 [Cronobacter turicensis]